MSRAAELEAEIHRLTQQRDAQPPDTLWALSHQAKIDELSVELAAWHLDPARMAGAEASIREAGRRLRRAQTGRRRWPVIAAGTGVLGTVAGAGELAAHTGPVIGAGFLAAAAAALALTAVDRARDARDAARAEADIETAQGRYAATVGRHAGAIAPLRPLAIHTQEDPCTPSTTPSTPATPLAITSGPVTSGGPIAAIGPSPRAAASRLSAGPSTVAA
jgi:type II secretory pathway pseudopilin PulG